ncbi:GNAT family N-acetyltransferase [Paenibacillus gallinarum]|nr:GNAT family N-acetyltransferase [Paenibacillus gallinarum]
MAGAHMITELDKQEFYKVQPITDQCRNLEVRAVVNGMNPGSVYVDHGTDVTAAMIWIQGQSGFHMVGDPKSESFLTHLETYMINEIEPRLKKLNIDAVEISVENDRWAETLQTIFKKRSLLNDNQYVFEMTDNEAKQSSNHMQNTMIHRIDRDLLESRGFENKSFLEQKIARFWESKEDFLQHGFGYIAEHNHNVISVCFSAFVDGHTHAVDIETLVEYRNKHVGTAVAEAYIEECKRKGVDPYWDCMPENVGSVRLAKKMGLSLSFDYRILWYNIT